MSSSVAPTVIIQVVESARGDKVEELLKGKVTYRPFGAEVYGPLLV